MKTAANFGACRGPARPGRRRDARRRRPGDDPCPLSLRRPPSLRQLLIRNRTAASGERLAAELRQDGIDAKAFADPEPAVREADIVSCLTASADPVLRGQWLRPGAHVDLVGGFTPAMRESDDDVVRRGRLFADTLRFTLTACGDYAAPIARGVIAREFDRGRSVRSLLRPHFWPALSRRDHRVQERRRRPSRPHRRARDLGSVRHRPGRGAGRGF